MSAAKLGVLGGTFNPIHRAHVRLAQAAGAQLGLDRVTLVPTYTPPHKQAADLASAGDRLAMCRLAVADLPLFSVSDCEIRRQDKSYTWRTLEQLHREHPDTQLHLLMGADMFLTVQDWREPERIYRLAVLCAGPRSAGELARLVAHRHFLEQQGARCELLDIEPVQLSSTQVRAVIQRGGDARELLHPAVLGYIRAHGLYGA